MENENNDVVIDNAGSTESAPRTRAPHSAQRAPARPLARPG